MEDSKYFTQRSQELDVIAQRVKDDFIDESLRLGAKFNRDWQDLLNKKGQLSKEQQDNDKINIKQ